MDIATYLKDKGVRFEMHDHPPAYTAQEMAAEEHVSGKMIAKAVIVETGGKYAICALPANCKLDMRKVAKAMKSKSVRLADEAEMAKLFPDVEVGAEPPMGNLWDLPTLVDMHLAADEEIVFQGGTHRNAVRMRYEDYFTLTHPAVADITATL